MLSADLIARIRRIEITSAKLVQEIFSGQYKSAFKGRGIEFAEIRDYQWGDDIRAMHWKAMARFGGKPFIKRFIEERQLTVMLAVDVSASESFGSTLRSKKEIVEDLAGLLAYLAFRNKDLAGLLLFSNRAELYLPPRSGRLHALRIMREMVAPRPASSGTNLKKMGEFLLRMLKKRAIVFLISDFLDEDYEREFALLARRHDLVAMRVGDPGEKSLPSLPAFLKVEDLEEPGSTWAIDLRRESTRGLLAQDEKERVERLRSMAAQSGVDLVEFSTDENIADALGGFFRRRRSRLKVSSSRLA